MLSAALLALAMMLQDPASRAPASAPQDPPVASTPVDDIIVEGQRLAARNRAIPYIRQVLAPARGSDAARWSAPLCIEVLNARPEVVDYVTSRLSAVATEIGVGTGGARCEPNVLIVMTDDGPAMAREMVRTRRREFITGATGTDRGRGALEIFQTSDAPVRWWHVSLPVDSLSGRPTIRLPGQPPANVDIDIEHPSQAGSYGQSVMGSILTNPDRHDLRQVVIVVDVVAAGGVDMVALTDYVALVALAQIDPAAETSGYDTILNLFEPNGTSVPFLTDWDWAFLIGLYRDEVLSTRGVGSIADTMARELVRPGNAVPD